MSKPGRFAAYLVFVATASTVIFLIRQTAAHNQVVAFPRTAINGHPTRLTLDTGSGSVVIWLSSSKRLGLTVQKPSPSNAPHAAPAGTYNAWLSQPARLTVGRQQLTAPLSIMDAQGFDGDGLIGWPEVRDLLLVFDPAHLVVRATNALPPQTARWLKFKIRQSEQLLVEIPLPGGKTGVLLLDSGSPAGVSLTPALWKDWLRLHPKIHTTPMTFRGLNGVSATTDWAWADKVAVGALSLSNVDVGEASATDRRGMPRDYVGTFGLEAISRIDLVVDGKNNTVYMRPRPAGTDYANDNDWTVADSVQVEADSLLLDAAEYQFGAGDFTAATNNLSRVLALNSNNVEAWDVSGEFRERSGDDDGAIAAATRALQLDPGNVPAWLIRGAAQGDKENWNAAIADCNQALLLDPSNIDACRERGTAREAGNDWNGAIADFTRVAQLDPTNVDSWLTLGAARQGRGDFAGALSNFDTASQLDSSNSDYALLYRQLLVLRQHKSATNFASSINGWRDGWAKNLGRFLEAQLDEKTLLAAAETNDVETVSGQRCEAYYFIGMKRLINGDRAGAREYFQKCLATREKEYYEYRFARVELARLASTPAKPR